MIEINLLPEEFKKKEPRFKKIDLSGLKLADINFNKLPLVGIGIGAIAFLILFHLILFLIGINSKASLAAISKETRVLSPEKREADKLRNDLDLINKKIVAIDGLMVKRFSWARKLNALSDSITPGIWLTEISYDEIEGNKLVLVSAKPSNDKTKRNSSRSVTEKVILRYLVISGYASSMGEQGTALIGKFIKALRDSSEFYSDFSEIKLGSIKTDKYRDQEVMNFKITCLYKNEEEE
jgi:Tfp pilus assembly protein PilN